MNSLSRISAIAMVVVTLGLQIGPAAASGLPNNTLSDRHSSRHLKDFSPPDRGAPSRTSDGGTRGCPIATNSDISQPKAVRVMSLKENISLTLAANPTLFFYVPSGLGSSAELVLSKFDVESDRDTEVVYKTEINLPEKGGLLSHQLPQNQLEVGQMYHWYIVVPCESTGIAEYDFSDGFIERTDMANLPIDLNARLATIDERDSLALGDAYAEAGVWHEALLYLAQARNADPNNPEIQARWQNLLNAANLGEYSEQ
ncbi:MAG: DUF928 domain-containing protein [Spirulinaceae cyanobacterium]